MDSRFTVEIDQLVTLTWALGLIAVAVVLVVTGIVVLAHWLEYRETKRRAREEVAPYKLEPPEMGTPAWREQPGEVVPRPTWMVDDLMQWVNLLGDPVEAPSPTQNTSPQTKPTQDDLCGCTASGCWWLKAVGTPGMGIDGSLMTPTYIARPANCRELSRTKPSSGTDA